jgi:hypothetical protein
LEGAADDAFLRRAAQISVRHRLSLRTLLDVTQKAAPVSRRGPIVFNLALFDWSACGGNQSKITGSPPFVA